MRRLLLIATIGLSQAACSPTEPEFGYVQLEGATMGTTWSAVVELTPKSPAADATTVLIQTELDAIDAAMSTWKAESELSRLNRSVEGEMVKASAHTRAVLALAADYVAASDGAFDPTVGPLVELWGFHDFDLDRPAPTEDEVADARGRVAWSAISVTESTMARSRDDVEVDLSAIAKGYAVDVAATALLAASIDNFLLEVGGELVLRGINRRGGPWRVGVDDPLPPTGVDPLSAEAHSPLALAPRQPYAVLGIADRAVATSGDYRNVCLVNGRYVAHAIDPRSGYPTDHDLASVTVVAPTCAEADALATAALVLGPVEGMALLEKRTDVEALLLVRIQATSGVTIDARPTSGMPPLILSSR